jgi:hypothetical protein
MRLIANISEGLSKSISTLDTSSKESSTKQTSGEPKNNTDSLRTSMTGGLLASNIWTTRWHSNSNATSRISKTKTQAKGRQMIATLKKTLACSSYSPSALTNIICRQWCYRLHAWRILHQSSSWDATLSVFQWRTLINTDKCRWWMLTISSAKVIMLYYQLAALTSPKLSSLVLLSWSIWQITITC